MNTYLLCDIGQIISSLRIELEKSIYSGFMVPLLCAQNNKLHVAKPSISKSALSPSDLPRNSWVFAFWSLDSAALWWQHAAPPC